MLNVTMEFILHGHIFPLQTLYHLKGDTSFFFKIQWHLKFAHFTMYYSNTDDIVLHVKFGQQFFIFRFMNWVSDNVKKEKTMKCSIFADMLSIKITGFPSVSVNFYDFFPILLSLIKEWQIDFKGWYVKVTFKSTFCNLPLKLWILLFRSFSQSLFRCLELSILKILVCQLWKLDYYRPSYDPLHALKIISCENLGQRD